MNAADRREYEAIVLPLQRNLYGAAMRLTRDPVEADDLVQDTMIRAYRFWDTFQQGSNVKAWMFTILRNTFINRYHRGNRRLDLHGEVTAQVRSLGSAVAVANSTSEPPGPDEAFDVGAMQRRIHEALDSLPAEYRTAVTLADLDGLSYKEIAEATQSPIGTVMSRIYRGRRILYRLLHEHAADMGYVDPDSDPDERPSTRVIDMLTREAVAS